MDEARARAEYGPMLAVASLGAVEKGARAYETVEVRNVHDGTHIVEVNPAIQDIGQAPTPPAPDTKKVVRHCAESGLRIMFMGLTADVKEASADTRRACRDKVLLRGCVYSTSCAKPSGAWSTSTARSIGAAP